MQGLVIKTTSNAYSVLSEGGEVVTAHIKGNIRLRGIRSTNPVAVGDHVTLSTPTGENDGIWITDIQPRRNVIVRRSTNLSKESHILAANIDRVALIITLTHPETNLTFVDRFLATAEAYRVPAILVFNKVDLLPDGADNDALRDLRALYEGLGYPTFAVCAKDPATLNSFRQAIATGYTLFSGNSGVGKSTILNALFGEERTRTADISASHLQGMHTTTFSEMHFLEPETRNLELGTWNSEPPQPSTLNPQPSSPAVIDTPGIRGFGTFDFQRSEVSHYFREIFRIGADCRYSDCLHTDGVPGCAVLPAVIDGRIAISRYQSYLSLLGDITETKYR